MIRIDFLEVGKGGKESFLPRVPVPGKKGEALEAEERWTCHLTENMGLLAEEDLVTDVERTNDRAKGNNRGRKLSIEKVKFEEDSAARYKKKVAAEKMKQESSGALGSFETLFREKLPILETSAWMGKLRDAEKDLRREQEYYVIRRLNVGSSDFTSEEAEEVLLPSEPDSEEMLGDLFSGNPPLLVGLEREVLYVRRVDAERSPKRVSEWVVTRLTSLSDVLSERLGKKIELTECLKTASAACREPLSSPMYLRFTSGSLDLISDSKF